MSNVHAYTSPPHPPRWCGPCQLEGRELPRVQGAFKEKLKVIKVNTDKYPEVCTRLSISALPTMLIFKDGKVSIIDTSMSITVGSIRPLILLHTQCEMYVHPGR